MEVMEQSSQQLQRTFFGGFDHSRYRPANSNTLKVIEDYNSKQKINLLLASVYISAEGAKLGYLLSKMVMGARTVSHPMMDPWHKTFFGNSTIEALSGAIKLARHYAFKKMLLEDGWILFVDSHDMYRSLFDPTGAGENAMCPNIRYVSDIGNARQALSDRRWAAVVVVCHADEYDDHAALRRFRDDCARTGAMFILAESEQKLTQDVFLSSQLRPDIAVFGENLTENNVPFGCFTMTSEVYSVWNTYLDCLAHTSTFGANGVALAVALSALQRSGFVDDAAMVEFLRIDNNYDVRAKYFAACVNPKATRMYQMMGLGIDVVRGRGARLWLADGTEIIDTTGCFGCNLRGHNPPDLISEVLDKHDPTRDYFVDLERSLVAMTGFHRVFPAVSGATAVDVALSMAMLASPKRTRIVTFRGNYSGKSLISMTLSQRAATTLPEHRRAFRPFYHDVVHIDPRATDCAAELRRVLQGGDVALVWFEMVQGNYCQALPTELFNIVSELKDQCGYFIGIDEVLTGHWRLGNNFLGHQGVIKGVDVVAAGKALSDMTFPIGVALVSQTLYDRACENNSELVRKLSQYYRNNLGAHIGWHAISTVSQGNMLQNSKALIQRFKEGLEGIARNSSMMDSVTGEGNLLRFNLNKKWFPYHPRSDLGLIFETALSSYIIERCGVLVVHMRFNLPLFTNERDVDEALSRLKKGLVGVTPLRIYRYVARQFIAFTLQGFKQALAGKSDGAKRDNAALAAVS